MNKTFEILIIFSMILISILSVIVAMNYFLNEPTFKITQEECQNVTYSIDTLYFEYGDESWRNNSVSNGDEVNCWIVEQKEVTSDNYGDIKCDVKRFMEKCKDVEVEGIIIKNKEYETYEECGKWDNNTLMICLEYPAPPKKYLNISKEDLLIEWLDETCLCQGCHGTWDTMYDNYVTCDIECSVYQCDDYKIEVIK